MCWKTCREFTASIDASTRFHQLRALVIVLPFESSTILKAGYCHTRFVPCTSTASQFPHQFVHGVAVSVRDVLFEVLTIDSSRYTNLKHPCRTSPDAEHQLLWRRP